MKTAIIIPARYDSTRYQGKPLAIIDGIPMIHRVYNQCLQVENVNYVIVATDDDRILSYCSEHDIKVMITDSSHLTGTDRIAEVAEKLDCEFIINVQGDEPFIEPENISLCLNSLVSGDYQVVSLMSSITSLESLLSTNVTKVVTNLDGFGLYISRSPIPYPRGSVSNYFKQLGVYGFKKSSLLEFSNLPRSKNEIYEEIEFLRFIDNNIPVKFINSISISMGVDSPEDILRILKRIKEKIEI